MIIGASDKAASASTPSQGAAYVYTLSGATWTQQGSALQRADAAGGDRFGLSVAISGATALVGAPGKQVATAGVGAAYVFVQSGTTWTAQGPALLAADGAASDNFGGSVALSGTLALVGASGVKVGPNLQQGAAYVFAQSGSAWAQQGLALRSFDGAAGDYFAGAVALDGTSALVGASYATVGSDVTRGAAYAFAPGRATGGACTSATECASAICSSGTCADTCAGSADCAAISYCKAGACVPRLGNGLSCGADDQCQSALCATICCDHACSPYGCDVSGCLRSCSTPAQCASGYDCLGGACVPKAFKCTPDRTGFNDSAGQLHLCPDVLCDVASGICGQVCKSNDDCPAAGSCDSAQHCVKATGTTPSSGGCTAASPGAGELAWACLVVVVLGALRRRRRAA